MGTATEGAVALPKLAHGTVTAMRLRNTRDAELYPANEPVNSSPGVRVGVNRPDPAGWIGYRSARRHPGALSLGYSRQIFERAGSIPDATNLLQRPQECD